jgi:hypothetical protein
MSLINDSALSINTYNTLNTFDILHEQMVLTLDLKIIILALVGKMLSCTRQRLVQDDNLLTRRNILSSNQLLTSIFVLTHVYFISLQFTTYVTPNSAEMGEPIYIPYVTILG